MFQNAALVYTLWHEKESLEDTEHNQTAFAPNEIIHTKNWISGTKASRFPFQDGFCMLFICVEDEHGYYNKLINTEHNTWNGR